MKPFDVFTVRDVFRDRATMEIAMTASETGHLVLGTLHTANTSRTLDRVLDVPHGIARIRKTVVLQERHQFAVLRQRERFSRAPVLGGDARALVADRAGYRREADGHTIPDIVIHALERVRCGEIARVVISNRDGLAQADGPGWAIREGIVVVTKNAVLPDGTTI